MTSISIYIQTINERIYIYIQYPTNWSARYIINNYHSLVFGCNVRVCLFFFRNINFYICVQSVIAISRMVREKCQQKKRKRISIIPCIAMRCQKSQVRYLCAPWEQNTFLNKVRKVL